MTAAARVGNARVMPGGADRGRGYFPSLVANRITGAPAIKGANVAHACACSDSPADTPCVSAELVVPKKACVCMMESFLSKSGHDKAAVVELARNPSTAKFHGFKLESIFSQGPPSAGLLL